MRSSRTASSSASRCSNRDRNRSGSNGGRARPRSRSSVAGAATCSRPAQRWLGHPQPCRRASEMKFLRDGDQPAQLFQRVGHARKVSINATRDFGPPEYAALALLGILPGGGAVLASLAAYALEKRRSRHPERFGRGAIEASPPVRREPVRLLRPSDLGHAACVLPRGHPAARHPRGAAPPSAQAAGRTATASIEMRRLRGSLTLAGAERAGGGSGMNRA